MINFASTFNLEPLQAGIIFTLLGAAADEVEKEEKKMKKGKISCDSLAEFWIVNCNWESRALTPVVSLIKSSIIDFKA